MSSTESRKKVNHRYHYRDQYEDDQHDDHAEPVLGQKVGHQPGLVLVGLWPVSQIARHHPDL